MDFMLSTVGSMGRDLSKGFEIHDLILIQVFKRSHCWMEDSLQ